MGSRTKVYWPSWRYGPNGQRAVFNRAEDVPEGWYDDPAKAETPQTDPERKPEMPPFDLEVVEEEPPVLSLMRAAQPVEPLQDDAEEDDDLPPLADVTPVKRPRGRPKKGK